MSNNFKTNDDINIVELFKIIYEGKWKIVLIVLISIISAYGYLLNTKSHFKAITNIKPDRKSVV